MPSWKQTHRPQGACTKGQELGQSAWQRLWTPAGEHGGMGRPEK